MDVDRAVRSAFELDVFPFSILKSIEISLLKTRKIVSSRMLIYSVLWIILYEAVRESEKSINNSIAITSTYLYITSILPSQYFLFIRSLLFWGWKISNIAPWCILKIKIKIMLIMFNNLLFSTWNMEKNVYIERLTLVAVYLFILCN